MILGVTHVTTYRYDTPTRFAAQSLRLFPSRFDGQRAIRWEVNVEGGVRGGSFRDGAGDKVEGWSVRGPVQEVRIVVSGAVETIDTAGVLRGHRELVPPVAYLRETTATWANSAIKDLAHDAVGGGKDPLDCAHRLSRAVGAAIGYEVGMTHSQTTAAEALEQGKGVCQDHAHVLVSTARVLDVPARYVSGYLLANDGVPHEAAHAWAEIWVENIGWIGFDAANNCCADENYIRLGSGIDSYEAAPIRGVTQGVSHEDIEVSVALAQVQQ